VQLYLTSFLCGATIMVLEILGFRMLPPYFGASTAVWGALLGVVMVALTAGYYAGGWLADRSPHPRMLYLMVGGAAAYTLLVLLGYRRILDFAARFELVTGSLLASTLLFAVPLAALGTVSPFVIRLLAREGAVGTVAGHVYAVSTVGSIVGTFLTSFYLIPSLGIRTSLGLALVTLVVVAGLGVVGALPRRRTREKLQPTTR